jgi:hypothetical protein
MFRRKGLSTTYKALRAFSEVNKPNNGNGNNKGTPSAPQYNELEFEAFKFKHERNSLIYGYTLQELYGKRYGLKHSPEVRREIAKDDIMMFIAIFGTLGLALASREQFYAEDKAFEDYLYSDMNYVRSKDTHNRE